MQNVHRHRTLFYLKNICRRAEIYTVFDDVDFFFIFIPRKLHLYHLLSPYSIQRCVTKCNTKRDVDLCGLPHKQHHQGGGDDGQQTCDDNGEATGRTLDITQLDRTGSTCRMGGRTNRQPLCKGMFDPEPLE